MTYVLALLATLALSGPAAAQHVHGAKGPNSGPMEDVAGVHAELITSGNKITVNVFDEGNKPISTKGFTASALVARGPERETVALVPDEATFPVKDQLEFFAVSAQRTSKTITRPLLHPCTNACKTLCRNDLEKREE